MEVDYNRPQVYEIGGLTVSGIKYLNPDQILSLTGIQIGDKIEIPGEELSSIIKRIWQQRWFSEIAFYIDSVSNGKVYLNLYLQERPRISMLEFEGVKSSERTELIDKLKIKRGGELSDYLEKSACDIIKKYYVDKGFLQTEVKVLKVQDTTINNAIRVTFVVDRKQKVKIQDINFNGN
ncbi:MAG TPA: POTRA domain-containing protein, partial [Bacteroidales bacterium]|nr:POTRA domain-containing protein [Bacteroidales bacterium]